MFLVCGGEWLLAQLLLALRGQHARSHVVWRCSLQPRLPPLLPALYLLGIPGCLASGPVQRMLSTLPGHLANFYLTADTWLKPPLLPWGFPALPLTVSTNALVADHLLFRDPAVSFTSLYTVTLSNSGCGWLLMCSLPKLPTPWMQELCSPLALFAQHLL